MPRLVPAVALTGLAVAGILLAVLFIGPPAPRFYADSAPIPVTPAPSPRNDCEATFQEDLFADFDATAHSNRPITAADLVPVFEGCTAGELVAADRYFTYTSGVTMTALIARRLFNGDAGSQREQFDAWCREPILVDTTACIGH